MHGSRSTLYLQYDFDKDDDNDDENVIALTQAILKLEPPDFAQK